MLILPATFVGRKVNCCVIISIMTHRLIEHFITVSIMSGIAMRSSLCLWQRRRRVGELEAVLVQQRRIAHVREHRAG